MSVTWETPKTDWSAEYDDEGLFIGDFFNVGDYNRIKNNLLYLRDLAAQLIYDMPEVTVGDDKTVPDGDNPDFDNDNFFADEINLIETALQTIDEAIDWADFGDYQTYYDNGKFIDADELNRIESATLELYELITNSIAGKQRLSFTLGTSASTIKV